MIGWASSIGAPSKGTNCDGFSFSICGGSGGSASIGGGGGKRVFAEWGGYGNGGR